MVRRVRLGEYCNIKLKGDEILKTWLFYGIVEKRSDKLFHCVRWPLCEVRWCIVA